jgi:hypothetical protein
MRDHLEYVRLAVYLIDLYYWLHEICNNQISHEQALSISVKQYIEEHFHVNQIKAQKLYDIYLRHIIPMYNKYVEFRGSNFDFESQSRNWFEPISADQKVHVKNILCIPDEMYRSIIFSL